MGGKSSPAPDYRPMAALSKEQLAFAKQQYADMAPLAQRIAEQQLAAQEQQMAQARDYYNYQMGTFRPVEQGLVREARGAGGAAEQAAAAGRVNADVARAFGVQRSQFARDMGRMGVDPSSGRMAAGLRDMGTQQALAQASGMTGARNQAQQLGYAKRMDAAGLGRNLAGASAAAYQGATAAGTSGLNTSMAPGTQYQQGLAGAANTMGTMNQGMASMYNAGVNAQGEMAGAILGLAATKASDRRLKDDIKLVGVDKRTGLNLYEFVYKGGSGDKYIGVMADEVKVNFPEAVITMPDGFDAVNYEMLGIEFKKV